MATALKKQIERYRQMTGEQRLAVALDLHELSCDVAREGIRWQYPDADADQIERHLRRRIVVERENQTQEHVNNPNQTMPFVEFRIAKQNYKPM